jgi:hypothetical protein
MAEKQRTEIDVGLLQELRAAARHEAGAQGGSVARRVVPDPAS